eukprot:415071_1
MHLRIVLLLGYILINTINICEANHRTFINREGNIDGFHSKYYKYSAMVSFSSDSMDSNDHDEYSNKEQYVALILSICLGGVGGGRWYIGDYPYGLLMLLLFVMVITAVIAFTVCPEYQVRMTGISVTFFCITLLIWLGLTLADIIRFALNDIKDGNDLTLYPM